MTEIINSANALPNLGGTIEVQEVTVTIAGGAGSVAVNYENDYDAAPLVWTSLKGDGYSYASAVGASQATVNIDSSTGADGDYTVYVLIISA